MKMVRGRSRRGIAAAAEALKRGGVVVFPTETVYGMGADAFNPRAVSKIFAIKGRPSSNPLIVHISGIADVKKLAREVPPSAKKLMRRFWPGPLTIVFKKKKEVPSVVTGGLDTVAVRMPSDPVAAAFLEAVAAPVAAPSANPSGRVSPVSHRDIIDDFPLKSAASRGRPLPDALIIGGRTSRGMESTIVDVSSGPPRILRHGSVAVEEISSACGAPPSVLTRRGYAVGVAEKIKSPGMSKIHYRPLVPLWVFPDAAAMKDELLTKPPSAKPNKMFVIAPAALAGKFRRAGFMVASFRGADSFSRGLYYWMRKAGSAGAAVMAAPLAGGGGGMAPAINDRLVRAASKIFL